MQNFASNKNGEFPPGCPGQGKHGTFTYLLPYIEESALYSLIDVQCKVYRSVDDPQRYAIVPGYVCPNYPQSPVVQNSGNPNTEGTITTYQGVGGAFTISHQMQLTSPGYGSLPLNGPFRWGAPRRIKEFTDGLSNTLMFGEFVHTDRLSGQYHDLPGNIRAWIGGSPYISAVDEKPSYVFKVAVYTPNTPVDRLADLVPFNHLPMGSFHPGITNFAYCDGGVHVIADDVNIDVYKFMCTINGGEVVSGDQL
jgi:hypothetical protein